MLRIYTVVILVIFFSCIGNIAVGQNARTVIDTPLISFKNKPKIFLTLDKTSSFISGKGAATNEIRFGLDFKRKIRFGIGYAALVSDIVTDKTITTEVTRRDSVVPAQLSMSCMTLSGEYTFYENKRWQITMPAVISIGSSYFNYFEKIKGDFITQKTDKGGVVLLSTSGVATYRILRWVGLSAGLGYRRSLISNNKVEESFNSPIYLFRIRIFMGEIYKSVFPKGIFGKHDPPYSNNYWD